jgi:hypothetical protein
MIIIKKHIFTGGRNKIYLGFSSVNNYNSAIDLYHALQESLDELTKNSN